MTTNTLALASAVASAMSLANGRALTVTGHATFGTSHYSGHRLYLTSNRELPRSIRYPRRDPSDIIIADATAIDSRTIGLLLIDDPRAA